MANFFMDAKFKSKTFFFLNFKKEKKKMHVGRWVGCNKMLLRALKQPNEFH